ncbi:hypothetical protein D3C86_1824140 [compost metagenome]
MIQVFDIRIHVCCLVVINDLNVFERVFFQRHFEFGRFLVFYRSVFCRDHDIVVRFSFRIHAYIELCIGDMYLVNFDLITTDYIP